MQTARVKSRQLRCNIGLNKESSELLSWKQEKVNKSAVCQIKIDTKVV
jgi:hypothetical protein